jgi:two-component system sensor histidine kinase PilS (NtrC family)
MSGITKPPVIADDAFAAKMRRLIFGRIAAIFLLLLASWWWTDGYAHISIDGFPGRLPLLFVVSIALTCVYYVLLRIDRDYVKQIRVQFLIDTILITWLVWETGDLTSPYVALYLILICIVGFFLGKIDTLLISAASAVSFTALSVLTSQALIYSFYGEVAPSQIVQIIAFDNIAILTVGLLAARLAERKGLSEELRHTEESFADLNILHERILESIRSGLITTDLEGRIYAFNRAAEEISGLRANDMIGQKVFSLFGNEIRGPVDNCLAAVGRDDYSPNVFEANFRETPPDVTVACSVSPLVGKSGAVTGLIVSFHDITQLRALQEDLQRADRLAAVGRMAAGLAHEIRNPLGSMSSALQFLQERVPPETQEASLMNVVLRESDRLNSIITNFLAYARPATNGFSKEKHVPVDIGLAMQDCLALLRHSPEVKDTHVLTFDPPDDPVKINANETQIKQVFWNLLQNSIQATPGGGTLAVAVKENGEKNACITIDDNGGGMSDESLEHLFEPFSRGSRGTGLGLSIVHNIVRDHGGRIDVQSKPGEGTCITIELPR